MLESAIQSKVIKELEAHGWYVVKLMQTNKNGIPDLIAHREGRTIYIEVKRPNLRPTPLQDLRHLEIKSHGIMVQTIRSVSDLYLYAILTTDYDTAENSGHGPEVLGADGEEQQQRVDRPDI
ncbi:MAG: VRR-NUC domain-containing protein [Caulobacteraceae bacterium]|nr:VRR-NUC domain-containing protein [Caulobacteraceae bacterium]